MRILLLLVTGACSGGSGSGPSVPGDHVPTSLFDKVQLTADYHAEGACVGDFNRDGTPDVASGPYWYAGPDFTAAHAVYPPAVFSQLGYADTFFTFAEDVDGDGWDDVVTVGLPGTGAFWYRNDQGAGGFWIRYLLWPTVGTESPELVDLDGDGGRELLCASGGLLTYLKRDPADATQPWTAHVIANMWVFGDFTHGLGTGDVDGDGRLDVLVRSGWFAQPATLAGDPTWTFHPFAFGSGRGGAQMHVDDVDGDGDGDVITSLDAHGYGLSWFEQVPGGAGITFVEHEILPSDPLPGEADQFSQLHAIAMADVDGDGLRDIVTGKTYLAHNGADPGAAEPAVIFALRLQRNGGVQFVPECVDDDSGIGRQVVVSDLDGDGRVDIVSGNKNGVFVFRNRR